MTPAKNWNRQERRHRVDRRTLVRQGKYERRKNRCSACRQFEPRTGQTLGYCRELALPMSSEAFACPKFEPNPETPASL